MSDSKLFGERCSRDFCHPVLRSGFLSTWQMILQTCAVQWEYWQCCTRRGQRPRWWKRWWWRPGPCTRWTGTRSWQRLELWGTIQAGGQSWRVEGRWRPPPSRPPAPWQGKWEWEWLWSWGWPRPEVILHSLFLCLQESPEKWKFRPGYNCKGLTMLRPREKGARQVKVAPIGLRKRVIVAGGFEENNTLANTPRILITITGLITSPFDTCKDYSKKNNAFFTIFTFRRVCTTVILLSFPPPALPLAFSLLSSRRTNPMGLRTRRDMGAVR